MKANITWNGKVAFSGDTPSGHKIKIDGAEQIGGQNDGARPMELLLHSLAGCTGINVINILQKMRLEPTSFQLEADGERDETPPKKFTSINLHFELEGDLPEDKVIRAIKLTNEKYCSVAHSLSTPITSTYSINGVLGEEKLKH
ncbi:OsmC family peroxiredoxin [Oceanobacillus piezotolerans]|uniref:OsmC family peroxiredoxin n=1 Tax=Oceanobacillus piezotolerans TaxID=2448030 RepID=A0A498D4C1_9BACI|nr:OsmC family protein [Oceanobacillus piezotolerans]RLL43725.1 OsmC family peroxiredoxin [Oceanobacillus piezotolerans]